jgi:hypothetical protein
MIVVRRLARKGLLRTLSTSLRLAVSPSEEVKRCPPHADFWRRKQRNNPPAERDLPTLARSVNLRQFKTAIASKGATSVGGDSRFFQRRFSRAAFFTRHKS